MRRNYMKLLAIAAVVLAAGCAENAVDGVNPFEGAADGYTLSVGGEKAGENGGEKDAAPDAGEEKASTRAELGGDGIYRWSPADRVGMFVAPAGGTTPILDNVRLTGINAGPTTRTDFEGELTRDQIEQFTEDATYDYYSYYPYDASVGSSGMPKVTISLPAVRSVSPDVFGPGCLMVAHATGKGPITWLDGGGQRFGEKISFSYDHVFAYAELYLACNLMSQRITRIKITDNGGGVLAGDFEVDMATGDYTAANASNVLTLDVEGGMDVLDGRLYIPIPAADLSSHTFTVELTTEHGNSVSMELSRGVNFQRGKVHKLALKVPFLINFNGIDGAVYDPGSGRFSWKGYRFGSNGRPERRNNDQFRFEAVNRAASGAFYYDGGDVSKDNDIRGTLTLPAMNVINTAGRADIPVKVEILGNGEAVVEGTLNTRRRFYFQAVEAEYDSYLQIKSTEDQDFGYVLGEYNAGSYDEPMPTDSGDMRAYLTEGKPALAMQYVGNFVSITFYARVVSHGHLFQVKLVPMYDDPEPGF